MKIFCKNIFVFFTIILLFNSILFWFANTEYYTEYEKIPDKSFSAFILSDSHGLPIGDFSEKYHVFNFSAGSESYFDMKRKILFLLKNGYKVDRLFITVDDHTLSRHRENFNNLDRSSVYYSLQNEYENHYEFLKGKYLKYYLPIFQPKISALLKSYLMANIKALFQLNKDSIKKKEWKDMNENDRIKSAQKKMKSHFPTDGKGEMLEKTLLEIIDICRINDIELIGIKYPLANIYIKTLGNRNYGADKLFDSNGLMVIDKKAIFVNNPEYFSNQDHLNSTGGEIFTKLLLENKSQMYNQ